jgi:hypothetical protein
LLLLPTTVRAINGLTTSKRAKRVIPSIAGDHTTRNGSSPLSRSRVAEKIEQNDTYRLLPLGFLLVRLPI